VAPNDQTGDDRATLNRFSVAIDTKRAQIVHARAPTS